jgi:hypothetical protein
LLARARLFEKTPYGQALFHLATDPG